MISKNGYIQKDKRIIKGNSSFTFNNAHKGEFVAEINPYTNESNNLYILLDLNLPEYDIPNISKEEGLFRNGQMYIYHDDRKIPMFNTYLGSGRYYADAIIDEKFTNNFNDTNYKIYYETKDKKIEITFKNTGKKESNSIHYLDVITNSEFKIKLKEEEKGKILSKKITTNYVIFDEIQIYDKKEVEKIELITEKETIGEMFYITKENGKYYADKNISADTNKILNKRLGVRVYMKGSRYIEIWNN